MKGNFEVRYPKHWNESRTPRAFKYLKRAEAFAHSSGAPCYIVDEGGTVYARYGKSVFVPGVGMVYAAPDDDGIEWSGNTPSRRARA